MATAVLGVPVDSGIARLLHVHSEGNPFFAEELLRAWKETRTLILTSQPCTLRLPLPDALPATIVGLVRERLARLSPEAGPVLFTAAMLGRTFQLTTLAQVLGQEEEDVEAES